MQDFIAAQPTSQPTDTPSERPPRRNRALRGLRAAGIALALSALAIATTAAPVLAWDPSSFSPDDENLLFTLTNQDRASAGLAVLTEDPYLHKEAEWRAQDMGDRDYFAHQIPPDGKMVFDYMQADHYCFKVAGENIADSTWPDDVATTRIETAFMNSTEHRENILGTWNKLGVGAYKAANGTKYYAVLFSIPCAVAAPKATPRPTAKPTVKPTAKPTVKPTVRPKVTQAPTPTPSQPAATDAPSDTPSPTPTPTAVATPADDTPSPTPSLEPTSAPTNAASTSGPESGGSGQSSLRVRDNPSSGGLLDSVFQDLFGGFFGW